MKQKKAKIFFGMLGLFLLSISLVAAHAGEDDFSHHSGCGMSGMMSGSFGLGGMFFGWIVGLLFVVILVLLIVWLIKQIQKK